MHPNPIFRKSNEVANTAFAQKRGFGTLALNAEPAPVLAHIPFVIDAAKQIVDFHLMRSNPIVRQYSGLSPAVISTMGPDSYISPDWYEVQDQVPTWNYVAVHIRGSITKLPESELGGILDRLSENFEERLEPKPVWTSSKMDPTTLGKMMRMIVPFRLNISEIDGTWKLGQNKPENARRAAATKVSSDGIGLETQALAALMLDPPKV
ncbi:MAG: FMN-binding negative transcriptional regulator [Paracoccaceae bacterium]